MKEIEIKSGVKLHYIQDEKFKTTTLGVYIHRPLNAQDASKNALLPMMLKRGCSAYTTVSDIEIRLQELYGADFGTRISKKGEDQILCFEAQAISDRYVPDGSKILPQLADLLFNIIFHPYLKDGAFDTGYVEGEKQNLLDMIDALQNDKQNYALWRCYEEMCRGEAFGIHEYGNQSSVAAIDAANLYEYYCQILKNSRIDVFVCGMADIEELAQQIKSSLADISTSNVPYPSSIFAPAREQIHYATDTFEANQAKLSLGLRTNMPPTDPKYYHLCVANSILGSGAHSKLFNNVREKLSLAYYAFSRLEKQKGTMLIGMGIEESNYQKALDETLLQIQNLKNGDVSDYEYNASKAALINAAQSYKDSQYAMTDFSLSSAINGGNGDIDEFCKKIADTTLEQAITASHCITLDTIYTLRGKEAPND